MRGYTRGWGGLLLILGLLATSDAGTVEIPSVALAGVPIQVSGRALPPDALVRVAFVDARGGQAATVEVRSDPEGAFQHEVRLPSAGMVRYQWRAGAEQGEGTLRVLPAWWSLLPPLVAIGLALLLRQVVLALVGGVWLGAWMVAGGEPFTALLRVVDTYLLNAYADRDHLQIIGFTMLLGGMIGVITRAGGLRALVQMLSQRVRSEHAACN